MSMNCCMWVLVPISCMWFLILIACLLAASLLTCWLALCACWTSKFRFSCLRVKYFIKWATAPGPSLSFFLCYLHDLTYSQKNKTSKRSSLFNHCQILGNTQTLHKTSVTEEETESKWLFFPFTQWLKRQMLLWNVVLRLNILNVACFPLIYTPIRCF